MEDSNKNNSKKILFSKWKKLIEFLHKAFPIIKENTSKELLFNICQYYSESHRFYHNLDHIDHMLNKLDELFIAYPTHEHPLVIELATWYHDIYYNPLNKSRKTTNEYLSSCIANMELQGILMLPKDVSDRTSTLILLTNEHETTDNLSISKKEQEIFLDSDKAILGESEEKYLEYSINIAKEFANFFSSETYMKRRIEFLYQLLTEKPMFHTEYMMDKYQKQALKNIKREIEIFDKQSVDDLIEEVGKNGKEP
jgi:predicted metal-dependent HD superfamily phosphohydrolase